MEDMLKELMVECSKWQADHILDVYNPNKYFMLSCGCEMGAGSFVVTPIFLSPITTTKDLNFNLLERRKGVLMEAIRWTNWYMV